MLKRTLSLLTLMFVSTNLVVADDSNGNNNSSFQGPSYEAGADFLWWYPCIDELEYAGKTQATVFMGAPASLTNEASIKSIRQSWNPGFKAYFTKHDIFSNLDLDASYTYMHTNSSSSFSTIKEPAAVVISPLVNPQAISDASTGISILGAFKTAHAKYTSTYQYWDVQFGYPLTFVNSSLKPFFGVAGIYFDQNLHSRFLDPSGQLQGDSAFTRWRSRNWGVGLKTGAKYQYSFSNGLGLFAEVEAALLASQYSWHLHQRTQNGVNASTTFVKVKKSSHECHFIPGYHLALGVNYKYCIFGYELALRVAYEMISWNKLANHPVFCSNSASTQLNSPSTNKRSLGFHGWLAGASVKF